MHMNRNGQLVERIGDWEIRLMPSGKSYYIIDPEGDELGNWYYHIERARDFIQFEIDNAEELAAERSGLVRCCPTCGSVQKV